MSFSILAANTASPALAYGLGQCATMVGAFWGVFIWKQFKGAPKGTNGLLAAMFLFYPIGLGVLILRSLRPEFAVRHQHPPRLSSDPMGGFTHTRRDFLKALAVGAASLVVPACVSQSARPKQVVLCQRILHQMDFDGPKDGWNWPQRMEPRFALSPDGLILQATENRSVGLSGDGIHTYNGDCIELQFTLLEPRTGTLTFGFQGGPEQALAKLDFNNKQLRFSTSEWKKSQPVFSTCFKLNEQDAHTLLIEKREGPGRLVKNADFALYLDGVKLLELQNQNVLPEMGVYLAAEHGRLLLRRFIQRGTPSGIPEHLHIGGWQMPDRPDLSANLSSICRGLTEAADRGVQLLVTPETSLTGLFPDNAVTQSPQPIAGAEKKLRSFLRSLKDAPYCIVGLPVWETSPNGENIRLNVSRLYAPDGEVAGTFAKIHSCETNFWHGYRLNEFDIYGAPVSMHICHDGRYPETWILPVMFGARVIVHPANPVSELAATPKNPAADLRCVTSFEPEREAEATGSSHAFYLHISGGGGSICGPNRSARHSPVEYNKWVSPDGQTHEALCHKRIRVHDAFGYWPMRSFRASEPTAAAYLALYRAMGGIRV